METTFHDDPVEVSSTLRADGHLIVHQLTWQGRNYPIVTMGRQWADAAGRYALIEAADGTRLELHLNRESLLWRVRKVWPRPFVV